MIILNGILWHKLQLLPISRVLISVWNDLWSYWTIVSCYEMGVENCKWYEMSILLILNVCVTKWVNFAIWLILNQSEQNSLTLLIFVMKWVTHIGQYEWFYLYEWRWPVTMTNDDDYWQWLVTMTNDYALYLILMLIMKFLLFLQNYATAFITLIWRLWSCWITKKSAPIQSDFIFLTTLE